MVSLGGTARSASLRTRALGRAFWGPSQGEHINDNRCSLSNGLKHPSGRPWPEGRTEAPRTSAGQCIFCGAAISRMQLCSMKGMDWGTCRETEHSAQHHELIIAGRKATLAVREGLR